jgi:hypothetical protein
LSVGYFESANCRRELYAALAAGKPIVAIREADTTKGGATIADLKAECRRSCTEAAPAVYRAYSGPEEALSRVFAQELVEWVRMRDFQVIE